MITALEADDRVKVVVFDSAVDGFFLTHYNFAAPAGGFDQLSRRPDRPAGTAGHARAPEPRGGRLDRRDPRSGHRGGQ